MENKLGNGICRVCFTSCDFIFESVEIITTDKLRILGLQLNLNTNGKFDICQTCSENLQKCFNFKTVCLYTEDCINFFRDDINDVKLNLREIYLKKNKSENFNVPQCDTICRLCMEIAELDCYIALNNETKDVISARIILERCFPELNLCLTQDPVICISCNASLHSYFEFIKKYLDTEDKLKKHEIEETDESIKPELKLQFAEENMSDYKCGHTEIKIRETYCESDLCDEIKLKFENSLQEEVQEVRIKLEVNELDCTETEMLNGTCNSDYVDMGIVKKCYKCEQNSETEFKFETFEETERQEGFNIKPEEIDLKTEDGNTRFEDNMLVAEKPSGITIYQCEICEFETKCKQNLKEHLILHSDVPEVAIQQCEEYDFKTKFECNLDDHVPIHRKHSEMRMYRCAICVFETKQKAAFRQHIMIHKSTSEVATYQCDICTFETKNRHVLKLHSLTHKNTSEVATYSCGLCDYKAKRKGHLKQHMLSHKNTSEVTTYSCRVCTYEAKRKGNLVQHMLTHNNSLEVAMYQCDLCTFRTRHKNVLKRHMLVHKNSSELPTFSCGICSYKAKQRGNLNRHMLVHKNDSEVITYQCDICAFKTRHKNVLRRHMLIHTRA